MSIDWEHLRRWPDIEGPGLVAVDAADRLILDESASARATHPGAIVVIGDAYGALTLGTASDAGAGADGIGSAGGHPIRVHQDMISGVQALNANAERLLPGLSASGTPWQSLPLGRELLEGARVVLLRLPRSLDALRDIAALIAAYASPDVVVFAGGRIKHMALAMNDVLREHFGTLDITHARQKARVLVARGPRRPAVATPLRSRSAVVDGLTICAFGGAFAGTKLDIGTRLLWDALVGPCRRGELPGGTREDPLIDLACGTGVIGALLARALPEAQVYATDASAVAVASAQATAEANGFGDRITVAHADALAGRPDASASFIALNPPFHSAGAVTELLAPHLFADAARVLRPESGALWSVWNTPLAYCPLLERIIGPTVSVARNAKFTVTVSTKRT